MTGQKTPVILLLAAVLMLGAAAAIVLSMTPWDALPGLLARAPRMTRAYLSYWFAAPATYALAAIVYFGAVLVWKPRSPSQGRFLQGLMIGAAVLTAAILGLHIVGMFVDRAQRAAFVAAGGAPSAFRFDPQLVITRIGMVAGGLFVAWMGNRAPKVIVPEGPSRQDRFAGARRIQGWIYLAAGLAMCATAFLSPIIRAFYGYAAIAVAAWLIAGFARLVYRSAAPPSPTASAS